MVVRPRLAAGLPGPIAWNARALRPIYAQMMNLPFFASLKLMFH
jgi:hypothetical protein